MLEESLVFYAKHGMGVVAGLLAFSSCVKYCKKPSPAIKRVEIAMLILQNYVFLQRKQRITVDS
ncbi:MAG: hypothetical protein K2L60_08115 [Bacteroides sp.]|nr:hypothetical protein [Bacteroides sp.]